MSDEILFFSDCHLHQGRPETGRELIRFLENRATRASQVYILGDLFEVWLGDDDPAEAERAVIEALQRLASDRPVFFIAGNRDFLLGSDFAARVGLTLLVEPQLLELGEHRTLLVHGDSLCTDDHDYQAFRKMVREPAWQSEFLARPLGERRRIAAQLRSDSADAMAGKSMEIMDVNREAVSQCFQSHGADTIIHGHTHRPAVHAYPENRFRYVLGDWNPEPSYLSWSESTGFRLTDPRL